MLDTDSTITETSVLVLDEPVIIDQVIIDADASGDEEDTVDACDIIESIDTESIDTDVVDTESIDTEVVDTPVTLTDDGQVFPDDPADPTEPSIPEPRSVYEVVFFAKYKNSPRPNNEELISYFSTYGVVHHVVCPENAIFAFVFMTSLSTEEEHRRTRFTIGQIIRDMDPNCRFHITVASSNRDRYQQPQDQDQTQRPRGMSRGRSQGYRGRGSGEMRELGDRRADDTESVVTRSKGSYRGNRYRGDANTQDGCDQLPDPRPPRNNRYINDGDQQQPRAPRPPRNNRYAMDSDQACDGDGTRLAPQYDTDRSHQPESFRGTRPRRGRGDNHSSYRDRDNGNRYGSDRGSNQGRGDGSSRPQYTRRSYGDGQQQPNRPYDDQAPRPRQPSNRSFSQYMPPQPDAQAQE